MTDVEQEMLPAETCWCACVSVARKAALCSYESDAMLLCTQVLQVSLSYFEPYQVTLSKGRI